MKVKLTVIARVEVEKEIDIPDDANINPDDEKAVMLWAARNHAISFGDGKYLSTELLHTKELKTD